MLLLPPSVRILLAAEPVDLRKSIDGLCTIVRTEWKEDLLAGNLFVFVSRRGARLKIVAWDNGGFVLTYKRLEQGRFRLPEVKVGALGAQLDATQLAMLLDGIDLSRVRHQPKWRPEGERQTAGGLINTSRWQPERRAIATIASGANGRKPSKRARPPSRKSSKRSPTNSRP